MGMMRRGMWMRGKHDTYVEEGMQEKLFVYFKSYYMFTLR